MLVTLTGCGGSNINAASYSISGKIGSYLNQTISGINDSSSTVPIGNGLYLQNSTVRGWPEKSGKFNYSFNGKNLRVLIEPLITETHTDSKGEKVALLWESPLSNKIVSIDKQGVIDELVADDGGVKWQLHVDQNHNNFTWVNFPADNSNDQIIYYSRENKSIHIIEDNNALHRYPKYNNGYIYWYQETMEAPSSREVSIARYEVSGKENPTTKVYVSTYPDAVFEFDILPNGSLAILKRNTELQKTDIVFFESNGNEKSYFIGSAFIQNIKSASIQNEVAFEVKEANSPWHIETYNFDTNKVGKYKSDKKNILSPNYIDGLLSYATYDSPMKLEDVANLLLYRYSPPLIGFSRYNNQFGVLSIAEAPIMRSLINMASATNDMTYWYYVAERANNILKRTDEALSINDYDNKSGPHWSMRLFSIDNSKYVPYLVHDALILDTLSLLATKLKDDEILKLRYPNLYRNIISIFERNYQDNEKYHIRFVDDKYNLIRNDESYYIFPYNSPYLYDGVNLPFNMLLSYVRPLLLYAKLTANDKYAANAYSMVNLFKRHIIYIDTTDSWEWPYWWGLLRSGWQEGTVSVNTRSFAANNNKDIEDVDHGSIDIRAIIALINNGTLFEKSDINKLVNTLLVMIGNDYQKFPSGIDGSYKSANNNSKIYLWSELAEYDKRANNLFSIIMSDFPYVQDNFTATARFELVGITHMMKSNIIFPPN